MRPRSLLRIPALLLPLPLTAQAPTPPPGFPQAWEGIESGFRERLEREGVVGGSLWVIHDGEVVARAHHGLADVDPDRPVDEETIYHWASNTKTLTAVAILQLRDRGRLSLDDRIVDHLPELRGVHDPEGYLGRITLRHLLSHSAGFRASTWPWGGDEPWHPHEPTRWEQLVAMFPYTEVLFEPGSRFGYSNPGIVFLGRVIEQLSGDDWEVYVDKNILKPLGMTRSYFDTTPYHLLPHRSNHFWVEGDTVRSGSLDFDTGITVSNGGLNAPLGDMAHWLRFLLGHEELRGVHDGVLARSSLEEMWQEVVPVSTGPGEEEWMGLSFFLLDRDGHRYVGHTGTQKEFYSFFYLDPETRTGVIAVTNTAGRGAEPRPDADAIRVDLRERLFSELFPLFQASEAASGAGGTP